MHTGVFADKINIKRMRLCCCKIHLVAGEQKGCHVVALPGKGDDCIQYPTPFQVPNIINLQQGGFVAALSQLNRLAAFT